MAVEIPCKEPNCPEKIHYERVILPGHLRKNRFLRAEKVVYLTCDRGHIHRYEINTEQSDEAQQTP